MDVVTWILTAPLAFVFLLAGTLKSTQPLEKLRANPNLGWTEDFSLPQIRAIGVLEFLGGLGLVLPWALDIAPVLTPLAAVGLAIVMVGAFATHARRGELKQAGPLVGGLFVLAVVVAVLRFTQL